jgi:hypothetical protein
MTNADILHNFMVELAWSYTLKYIRQKSLLLSRLLTRLKSFLKNSKWCLHQIWRSFTIQNFKKILSVERNIKVLFFEFIGMKKKIVANPEN